MNRMPELAVIVLSAIQLAVPAGAGEIYRWTDAQGGQHFSMDLHSVPPQYRAAAKASAGSVGKDANINLVQQPERSSVKRRAGPASADPRGARRARSNAQATEKIGGHDESWWRSRAERYASEISTLEDQIDRCKDLKVPARYNYETGRRTKRQHYDKKMAAAERCSSQRSTLDVKKRQLANFQERARKQGVPPGWTRAR